MDRQGKEEWKREKKSTKRTNPNNKREQDIKRGVEKGKENWRGGGVRGALGGA